jgi:predicted nucleic acid-binding Zn ribbon protein
MGRDRPLDDDPDRLAKALRRGPREGDVVAGRSGRTRPHPDEDDEGPSAADLERFGDVTRRCPECGKDVFDDTAVCAHCGHAFEKTTSGSGGVPAWVMIVAALILTAFVLRFVVGVI